MDYSDMLKAELVAELEKRGLDIAGKKADLIAKLEADDAKGSKKVEVKEKAVEAKAQPQQKPKSKKKSKKKFNAMTFRFGK